MSAKRKIKPYIPNKLPLRLFEWKPFIRLIAQANADLARYDGTLQGIVNPDILLSPLTTQEAVLSSKIEGTLATLEEVLEFEASAKASEERRSDILEIINYREAMQTAIRSLEKRPISLNLVKEIHSVLMRGVRGHDKGRGRFRRTQNFIGKPGSSIEQATFIPPQPNNIIEHLSNLEKYVHYDEEDRLVQLAIVHAQFELIHPFSDGNGRVGRILVPLFLYEKKMLSSPMFYISAYLEANRELYNGKLQGISEDGDWRGWIKFFLEAIIEQAKINSKKAKAILDLYEHMKKEVARLARTQFSIQVLDALFDRPIFQTTDFVQRSNIPRASAMRILKDLQKEKILIPLLKGRGRRASTLMFTKLIKVVEGKVIG